MKTLALLPLLLPPFLTGCGRKAPPPAPAQAAAPAAAKARLSPPAAAPAVSTPPAAAPPTVATFYTADGARDIFVPLTGASAGMLAVQGAVTSAEAFSIHNLELRGLLDAPSGEYALLVDPNGGAAYILKGGRLFDARGKTVPGIFGRIRGKRVRLTTLDKDVQDLKLGGSSDQ